MASVSGPSPDMVPEHRAKRLRDEQMNGVCNYEGTKCLTAYKFYLSHCLLRFSIPRELCQNFKG